MCVRVCRQPDRDRGVDDGEGLGVPAGGSTPRASKAQVAPPVRGQIRVWVCTL